MIEGMIQIGQALPSQEGSLANLIQEMSPTKNKKQLNVLKINFDLENDKLVIEVNEEVDSTI